MKQHKNRTESKEMKPPVIKVNSIEAAKAALPFFGGTPDGDPADDTNTTDTSTTDTSTTTSTTDAGKSGGGDTTLTPDQIQAIVAQNAELTNTLKTTNKQLETFTQKEKDAEKAKLGDVERAQAEVAERDETITNMDRVIRTLAVENAINNSKDLKFHSAKHVIGELDPTEYEIDVDLKSGQAVVSNLDKALKRIADANPWMVVDAAKDNPGNGDAGAKPGNQNPGGAPRRGSGAPPAPGNKRQSDATNRRADLIKKFPVLAARGAKA